uniref:Uncharacterized protein n=1 Tax=Arundo donax TaxID=35708 RepID=A0A0A8ZDT8_ARUDO
MTATSDISIHDLTSTREPRVLKVGHFDKHIRHSDVPKLDSTLCS